jgi:hypothetical protein
MIEASQLAGRWIDAGEIRPLVNVAVVAGQGEVARDGAAAMFAGNDVVKLEGNPGPALWQAAILATPAANYLNGFALAQTTTRDETSFNSSATGKWAKSSAQESDSDAASPVV